MIATVYPGRLSGRLTVPPSKSYAHRMLIAAALADRPSILTGIDPHAAGWDVQATRNGLAALGASIMLDRRATTVRPIAKLPARTSIDCGESGTTLRFLLPIAASLPTNTRFIGRGRLPQRPIGDLINQLSEHGAKFTQQDKLPFSVEGGLAGGEWSLPGNVSSQYISGLLFALPRLDKDSRLTLTTPLESKAYVDMTIETLRLFGVEVTEESDGYAVPGGQRYRAPDVPAAVEGDWSGASYWIEANALGSSIIMDGLPEPSLQPDRDIASAVKAIRGGADSVDISGMPDAAPALAVICAGAKCPAPEIRITGVSRLRLKESDRVLAIVEGLNALGVSARVDADAITIPTGRSFHSGSVNGRADHRIVMAFAIAAVFADGPVTISGAESVSKSYVRFWKDMETLGGKAMIR